MVKFHHSPHLFAKKSIFVNTCRMTIIVQIQWLFILAVPVACISWTVTHEEVFREPRDYCETRCPLGKTIMERKLFYLFPCEYCLSHYVTAFFLFLTGFKLLLDDWRGYFISEFALVWIANLYMSFFGLLRQNIKKEKSHVKLLEEKSSTIEKIL